MKNNELKKYMRFLRLFLHGIFNRLDRELTPKVTMIIYEKKGSIYHLNLLPDYHNMNNQHKINSKISLKEFFESERYLSYSMSYFKDYDLDNHLLAFYSKGAVFDDFIFHVRLTLNKDVYNGHKVLKKGQYVSLIDASVKQVIREISNRNKTVLENMDFQFFNYKDTLRKAANNLITTSIDHSLILNLFEQINNISSLYYESSASTGRIIFTHYDFIKNGHEDIEQVLLLSQRVSLHNTRLIRKLLEICKAGIALLSDGKYVYGISKIKSTYTKDLENIFVVDYLGLYEWEFNHHSKGIIRVNHNEVFLPQNKVSFSEFKSRVLEIFEDLSSENIVKLYSIMIKAIKQKHGTMLVISRNARSETNRLKSQGFLVKPKEITPNIVYEITSIDGAVLLDPDCICYGIGVILDGMATTNGDTSRGARYNSAIRYVETIKKNKNYSDCLAIVISEDGYVDLISKYTINSLSK